MFRNVKHLRVPFLLLPLERSGDEIHPNALQPYSFFPAPKTGGSGGGAKIFSSST